MTNQEYLERLISLAGGGAIAGLIWTIYCLTHITHPDLEDDEVPHITRWSLIKTFLHWRLINAKISEIRGVIFFAGNLRNYRWAWHHNHPDAAIIDPDLIQEKIVGPALRHPNGMIYSAACPGRHHDVIRYMDSLKKAAIDTTRDQGFVTTHGRYLDRREALFIALAADQIKHKTPPMTQLFSEDMW